MNNNILYGIIALLMIVAIAYGGSWLYRFLVDMFRQAI